MITAHYFPFGVRPDQVTRSGMIQPFQTQESYTPGQAAQNVVAQFTTAFTQTPAAGQISGAQAALMGAMPQLVGSRLAGPRVTLVGGRGLGAYELPDQYESMAKRIATKFAYGQAVRMQVGNRTFDVNANTEHLTGIAGQVIARAKAMISGQGYDRKVPNLMQTSKGGIPMTPGYTQGATMRAAQGNTMRGQSTSSAIYVKR